MAGALDGIRFSDIGLYVGKPLVILMEEFTGPVGHVAALFVGPIIPGTG